MQQDSFDYSVAWKTDITEVVKQHFIKQDHTEGVITGHIDHRKWHVQHYLIKASIIILSFCCAVSHCYCTAWACYQTLIPKGLIKNWRVNSVKPFLHHHFLYCGLNLRKADITFALFSKKSFSMHWFQLVDKRWAPEPLHTKRIHKNTIERKLQNIQHQRCSF